MLPNRAEIVGKVDGRVWGTQTESGTVMQKLRLRLFSVRARWLRPQSAQVAKAIIVGQHKK